jgi:hypothetical protein
MSKNNRLARGDSLAAVSTIHQYSPPFGTVWLRSPLLTVENTWFRNSRSLSAGGTTDGIRHGAARGSPVPRCASHPADHAICARAWWRPRRRRDVRARFPGGEIDSVKPGAVPKPRRHDTTTSHRSRSTYLPLRRKVGEGKIVNFLMESCPECGGCFVWDDFGRFHEATGEEACLEQDASSDLANLYESLNARTPR